MVAGIGVDLVQPARGHVDRFGSRFWTGVYQNEQRGAMGNQVHLAALCSKRDIRKPALTEVGVRWLDIEVVVDRALRKSD